MTRDELERAIDAAFADARMPRTEAELTSGGIDGPYVVKHFLGRSRADVETGRFMPSLHMEDFTYMTPEAVAYYLPVVLRFMLAKPSDDELWIFLSAFLRGITGTYADRSLTSLSVAQRTAIADCVDYLAEQWQNDEWRAKEAKKAAKLARRYRET
ncbi:MAG TPA: hypothetical protein VL326_17790 [Kofleriaceae bacterium]|jgi:hypothetical protein|nr:hypothetical protein [Kofleriaceae bacterium]